MDPDPDELCVIDILLKFYCASTVFTDFSVFFIVSILDVTSNEVDMGKKLIATIKNMDRDLKTFRIFYSCHFRE